MLTDNNASTRVSVIIPTLNAGKELKLLIERLHNQTMQPYEIIVIDSESNDGTAELAQQAGAHVLTVKRSEFDHGGTRNRAAEQASGNILMFMTQDALPYNEKLIEELVKPLADGSSLSFEGETAYTYARQCARSDANWLEQLARRFNYPEHSQVRSSKQLEVMGIKTFFCSNVCSAIRRDVFEKMGRFQEPVIFNEDMFMAAKCILSGYQIAYCAEAKVIHSHNYSVAQQFKRYFDNGVSIGLNEWIKPYSAVGGAGSRLVRVQLEGLHANRKWHLVPKLIAESAAKLIGFKLGYNHRRIPKFIVRRVSMHPLIWGNLDRVEVTTNKKHTINH